MDLLRLRQPEIQTKNNHLLCFVQLLLVLFCFWPGNSYPSDVHDPCCFVIDKLKNNNVVLLGTVHQRPAILGFISKLIPKLSDAGVTHIGLEIASDQQPNIDRFMKQESPLADIEIFPIIDCPEYRCLFEVIRNHGVETVALDLPFSMWESGYTRDNWIAKNISTIFDENPQAKIFVIVGSLHTLKKVEWLTRPHNARSYIRGYLSEYQPHLKVCSIAASIDNPSKQADSGKVSGKSRKPVALDAKDLDLDLTLLKILAIKPIPTHEAVDAVIVY